MFDVLEKIADEAKIENGVFHHFFKEDDVGDRELLYLDADKKQPCRALVRSSQSTTVRRAQRLLTAKGAVAGRKQKNNPMSEVVEGQIEVSEQKLFAAALIALENCDSTKPGQLVHVSEAEALSLTEKPNLQWMVAQVINFSNDQTNYAPGSATVGNEKKAKPGPTSPTV